MREFELTFFNDFFNSKYAVLSDILEIPMHERPDLQMDPSLSYDCI